jgi:hypothetical protein
VITWRCFAATELRTFAAKDFIFTFLHREQHEANFMGKEVLFVVELQDDVRILRLSKVTKTL